MPGEPPAWWQRLRSGWPEWIARWRATTRILVRSLGLVWAADPPRAAWFLALTATLGLLPVGTAWLSKLVLDRVGAALQQPGDAAATAALAATGGYVALRFLARVLEPAARQLEGNLQTRTTGHVQRRLLEAGAAIPDLDHFERAQFHDEIALLEREVSWRPKNVLDDLHDLARSPLSVLGLLALLWRLQPVVAVLLALATIPQVRLQRQLQVRVYQSLTTRSAAGRLMAYFGRLATDPAAAKELLVFGLGPWLYRRWRQLSAEAVAEAQRLRRDGIRTDLATLALDGLVLAGSYVFVALQLSRHHVTLGDFALYLSAIVGLQQALATLTVAVGSMADNARYLGRLFAFLGETRPSIVVAPPGTGLPVSPRFRQGLELRDVCFGYPGQRQPVLDGVTCTLGAGETVALVGPNGAGKTTLVKLLTRLYDPTGGAILLDGIDLRAYDLGSLRRRTAVLFQDFAHFALSAQQNIGVGEVAHADDRERVLTAARWAGADTVLTRLPQGLETPLTKAFAGGVELSGGEWQKVAMARAAMRDAALVILDEPTAALDAQAEAELFGRFRALAEGRTVLLISHRFSTVRMADRILVLEGGRIIEAGSHAELITLGGRYATLYELQAGRYR